METLPPELTVPDAVPGAAVRRPAALLTLELALDPALLARLRRALPRLARRRGRTRQEAIAVAWHDTEAGALAAAGLALAEQGRVWRLERLVPGDQPWPPGTPAPVLAEAPQRDGLGRDLPEGLGPVARLAGRRWVLALEGEAGPLTAELLALTLHGPRGDTEIGRLRLQGEAPAVAALALALGTAFPLRPPRAGLAAEALAAARGSAPPPRHLGAALVPRDSDLGSAFALLIGQMTDCFAHWAQHSGAGAERVHQMRVALRRLRAGVRVFAPLLDPARLAATAAALREAAHRLGPARDWDVFLAGTGAEIAAVLPGERRIARLLAAARARREAAYAALGIWLASASFTRFLLNLVLLAAGRPWEADEDRRARAASPLGGYAPAVLARGFSRMRAGAGGIAERPAGELHALRLRCKRLRYTAEIMAPLYPGKAASRFLRRLARLSDRLGHINDGAVAAGLIGQLAGKAGARGFAAGAVAGLLAARAPEARKRAARAWARAVKAERFWA